jgi:hypothetical protein
MRSLLLAVLSLALAGCAGYKLGPTNGAVAGAQSIQIKPVVNRTIEPRLSEYLNNSLRKEVQRDGTYRLETQGRGDIFLSGEIIRFERGELAYQPVDVLTPRDYNLVLFAQITAVNALSGKTNFSRVVSGRTEIRVGSDLSSAERQAIPLLTQDLAKNAISLLTSGMW